MRTLAREVAERFSANAIHFRRRAEALGTRAALHRMEISPPARGVRMLQLDTVLKISGALDISLTAPTLELWTRGKGVRQ